MKIHDLVKGQVEGYAAWRAWFEARPYPKPVLDIPLTAYLFSLVVDGRGTDADKIERTLASLLKQYFRNIEVFLLLDDEASKDNWQAAIPNFRGLRGLSCHVVEPGVSILAAVNGFKLRGDYIGCVAPGTQYDPPAFDVTARMLRTSVQGQDPDVIVFDWDVVQDNGSYAYPCFTPGWDELLYREVDYLRDSFLLARTYCDELAGDKSDREIRFKILQLCENGRTVKSLHVDGTYLHLPRDENFEAERIALPLPHIGKATSSIIIPNKDSPKLLKACVETLLRTTATALEIVIVDNNTSNVETVKYYQDIKSRVGAKIIPVTHSFNFARMINKGVAAASAETLVLLNNDIEFTEMGQLDVLVQWTMMPRMGAVGSVLRYADQSIQHAGCNQVPLNTANLHVGRHARKGPGYLGMFSLPRSWQVVTGALLGTRREVFDRVGGMNEIELPVEYNDVDYCLSVGKQGLDVCCLPLAGVLHKESASRETVLSVEGARIRALAELYMAENWMEKFVDDKFNNRFLKIADVDRPTLQGTVNL